MYASLVEPLSDSLPLCPCSVVGVVDDDLAAYFEEVPNLLFAAQGDFMTEFYCFWGLFSYILF